MRGCIENGASEEAPAIERGTLAWLPSHKTKGTRQHAISDTGKQGYQLTLGALRYALALPQKQGVGALL